MTIHTLTYNESLMLPFFVEHYRSRFANCEIVVYDNESTDGTQEIAKQLGCKVETFKTGNKLSDTKYLDIKNSCWKGREGWVIVADCDELLDITSEDLYNETIKRTTVIIPKAFNMVNMFDNLDLPSIKYGVRSESYDKAYCFNASAIKEINYTAGCHSCVPFGNVNYSLH